MKYLFISFILIVVSSCYQGEEVDLIIHNAIIHKDADGNKTSSAMAIRNGVIIEIGPERQILNKYSSKKIIDAKGRHIYPGLIDGHAHLLSYSQQLLSVDLYNLHEFDQLMERCESYDEKFDYGFIIGRGWDQTLWRESQMPTNQRLNELFPNKPVCLYRIDGHAVLVNDFLLEKAGINQNTKIKGGEIILSNNAPTGLLIDNAIDLIQSFLPEFPIDKKIESIKKIENELFGYGITGIHEAGINYDDISFLKMMMKDQNLKLNIYAMLYPSEDNYKFVEKHGHYNFKNLTIRSFKAIADGALGSHGALLKKVYSDENHNGLAVTSRKELRKLAIFCLDHNYQMNTHCIGDSANSVVLNLIKRVNEGNKNHRFRIEHAQIVDPVEFDKFMEFNVIPSVQPTHATSDMRWAKERIGEKRLDGAYAYKTLLEKAGLIVLGTDFPVEKTNPFLTLHAAVQRKNENNEPSKGYYINERLSLKETLKGMTCWPAYASFDEKNRGSLTEGKIADFVIMKNEIESKDKFIPNFSWKTFIAGQEVYSSQ